MTFTLTIHDRNGIELKQGDIVKIINSQHFIQFYSEVKYLPDEQAISPFHTFAFHSVEKVDKLPEGAIKSTEERYNIWYLTDPEDDKGIERHTAYLSEWRDSETLLREKIFRIKLNKQLTLF